MRDPRLTRLVTLRRRIAVARGGLDALYDERKELWKELVIDHSRSELAALSGVGAMVVSRAVGE